jgi:alkanesulfonate monooxygenase SsuD/methylene tetrahydromethanopterin reductase-like flavin-dependent oxidoreductase (luciferase family)
MTLQFGLFDHIEGIPGHSMRQVLADRLELIRLADAAGFAGYHLAEHHGSDLCLAPNQEIFLAAAAQATTQIRLGPMIKILPVHHPLRVIEDICMLDQLSGGRVDYGVGRGIAAIEHFWFDGDWFAAHDRFDEALALILTGLRNGRVDADGRHYRFPPIDVTLSPLQTPNPPFWYPGNPVTAGRFGLNLVWPGPIPADAYDLYRQTWADNAANPVRAEAPGAGPRVGSTFLLGIGETEAEGKAIAARGWRGLARRINHVHTLDRLALDEQQAAAALNPLAHACLALAAPGGEQAMMPVLTEHSGTPEQVRAALQAYLDEGRCEYLILQLPTGDMTFEEARRSLQLFIDEVMPGLRPAPAPVGAAGGA